MKYSQQKLNTKMRNNKFYGYHTVRTYSVEEFGNDHYLSLTNVHAICTNF